VLLKSLSARLLILTVFFVMVSEVLIFVPSVARYRMTYFENRLAAGYLATLAFEASPTGRLDQRLIDKLLARVGAQGVALHHADGMVLRLDRSQPPRSDFTIDLTHPDIVLAIRGSLRTLFGPGDRVLRVLGPAGRDNADTAEVLLDEKPLRAELWDFGIRILELSLVISLVTAALVYLSLQWLLVRPMRRITASMVDFREGPEDTSRVIAASRRSDEIGVAERELAVLQSTVRQALTQRARLAALGTAVTKINHDLRNILATARLVTDGLTASAAPEVRRIAPRLLDAIDRAIALCTSTLDFSREGAPPLAPSRFSLAPLIGEIGPGLAGSQQDLAIECAVPPDLAISSTGCFSTSRAMPSRRARTGCAFPPRAKARQLWSRSPMTGPVCRRRRGRTCSARFSARRVPAAAGLVSRSLASSCAPMAASSPCCRAPAPVPSSA
jgi:signal transduction histidine kinase